MTWAQRLKRVFNIDVEICSRCGIDKILSHLKEKDGLPLSPDALPEARAPPQTNLLGWHQNSLIILLAGANRRQGIAIG
jgi:hypothetical protein